MLELLLGLAVAVVCLGMVLEPMVRLKPAHDDGGAMARDWSDLDEADSPKVRALTALAEIDFDLATGKLSEDDHATLKARYSEEALAALAVEKKEDDKTLAPAAEMDPAEAAISQARESAQGACPVCDNGLEPGAAFCSSCGCAVFAAEARARCWTCGSSLEDLAAFCSDCGAPVKAEAATD
jgi:hypothetical protein